MRLLLGLSPSSNDLAFIREIVPSRRPFTIKIGDMAIIPTIRLSENILSDIASKTAPSLVSSLAIYLAALPSKKSDIASVLKRVTRAAGEAPE